MLHVLLALASMGMFVVVVVGISVLHMLLALASMGMFVVVSMHVFLAHILFEINYEAQGLCLGKTLAPREHIFDLDALFNVLATRTPPGYERARLGGEIPLGVDVVCDVRQTLALEVGQVETDALGRSDLVGAVHIFVVHPNGLGNVRDNKVEGGLRGAAGAAGEQVLDGAAALQTHGGAVLPPGDRAPLGVNEALLEDVVEDVLEVKQVRSVADVDELGSDLLVRTRRLVVGDPELGTLGQSARGSHV